MGHAASKPDPSARMQVVGCGMSRTGTASFCKAIEILLGGPVYHGGTQLIYGGERHILRWTETSGHTPIKTEMDRKVVLANLKELLAGYSACADAPPILFTGELVEVFPDAKFICTTRDPEKWWKSMEPITAQTDSKQRQNELVFGWTLALLPTLRHWNKFAQSLRYGRFGELFYQSGHNNPHPGQYQEHIDYVKRSVPEDRLFFYDVAEGWEPLCRILDVKVPEVPFPRVNDSEATDRIIKAQLRLGLMAWAGLFGIVAAGIGIGWKVWRQRRG